MQRSCTADSRGRLAAEAIATGVAYAALLWWLSTCLVGSFRPGDLAQPYWSAIPGLRTDTSGVVTFPVAALCIYLSHYFRLRRRGPSGRDAAGPYAVGLASWRAAATSAVILATGLFGYLSVNVVTHPDTRVIQATHLVSWPSESTLRIVALLLCAVAAAVLRFTAARHRSTAVLPVGSQAGSAAT